MVRVVEYKPDEFMIGVSVKEAMLIIKSLSAQIINNDANRERHEFSKHHTDDVQYFSIVIDPTVTEFQVVANTMNSKPMNDMVFHRCGTAECAREFIKEFCSDIPDMDIDLYIKEVKI